MWVMVRALERLPTVAAHSNSNNVQALNSFSQSSPLGSVMGGEMKPATPAATKYALFFAAISGVGGAVLMVQSRDDSTPTS
jgi:hypothetical protein